MAVKFRGGRPVASSDVDNFSSIATVRGLLAGLRSVPHATDGAASATPHADPSPGHAAAQSAVAHVQSPAALSLAPAAVTVADSVLFAVSAGGGNGNAILRVGDDNGANVGNNLARLFANNPAFHNLLDLSLDVDHGYYFVVDSDFNNTNRILRGNIADLVSGTTTPSLTQVFATDNLDNGVNNGVQGEGIQNIEIDTVNQKIYWFDGDIYGDFEGGFQFNVSNYDGTGFRTIATIDTENQDPTFGFPGGVGDFAIDKVNGYAYVVSATGGYDGNGDGTAYQNDILRIDLTTGAITFLNLGTSGVADGYHAGRLDPAQYGLISSVDVDQTTGQVYFTTQPLNQNDHGGVFKFVPGATVSDLTAGTLSTLWTQPADSAYTTPQSFPTSLITNIEFDEVTGRYFLTATYDAAENNASIFVGSGVGTPTLFQQVTTPAGTNGAPLGMEIDYAATLTQTGANATYTEGGAAVSVLSSVTLTDPDNATLKGATVKISANFVAGDVLSVTTTGTLITASYNSATGVLSLSGSDTLAHYQSVIASLKYAGGGDNPTAFDTALSRTISFTTFDGLVNSDAVTATVNVAGVNDAPVNSVPGGFTIAEDATPGKVFSTANGNAISVSDPDASTLKTTLTVGHGTLTLSSTAGLTVTGNGTGTLSITGSTSAINTALGAGLTYVATADYNGADSLGVVTTDQGSSGSGGALTDTDSVAITITPVADIANDTLTINEDAPATNVLVQTNDTFENANHAITGKTDGAHGTVTINDNGTAGNTADDYLVYTADADYFGTDSFTYTVTSGGATETAIVNVTVNPVNDAPTAAATGTDPTYFEGAMAATLFTGFTASTGPSNESGQLFTQLTLTVTNVDSGHDALTIGGNTLTLTNGNSAMASGITATVSITGATATVTFTSAGTSAAVLQGLINNMGYRYDGDNPDGADRVVTITSLTDNGGTANGGDNDATLSLSSTVHLTPVNDAPVSTNFAGDAATFTENGGAVALDVGGNATLADADSADFDGGSLTVTITANKNAAQDVLGISGSGTTLSDGTNVGSVVSVNGVAIGTIDSGGTGANGNNLIIAFNPNATPARVEALLHAITYENTSEDPTTGTRTIAYSLNDGDGVANGGTNTALFTSTVAVLSVNDEPAGADGAATIAEDAVYTFSLTDFPVTDVENDALLAVKITTLPTGGSLLLNAVAVSAGDFVSQTDIAAGNLTFVPAADGNGSPYASFTFQVQDDGGTANGGIDLDQSTNTFTITVTAVSDIVADNVSVREDRVNGFVDLLGNDTFEDPTRAITAVGTATHGSVAINDNGTAGDTSDDYVTYTAYADYNGADSFTYTVTSGGKTETATVNLTVTAVKDIVDDVATVAEDSAATRLNLLANDTFEDTKRAITAVGTAAHGTVTINDNGTALDKTDDYVTYKANADYFGTDGFTYTVTSGGVTETATVKVTVTPVMDANNDTLFVYEDSGRQTLDVLANDTFSDPNRAITSVSGSAHGTVRIDNMGTADKSDDTIVYTANANYNGADSFSYTVTSGGKTETATVRVQVRPVNDAPSGTNGGASITRGDHYDFTAASFGFHDSDGDGFRSVYVTTVPAHGNLIFDNGVDPARIVRAGAIVMVDDIQAGYLSFVPDANAPRTLSFKFQVRDDGGVANGGVNQDATPNIFTLTLTAPSIAAPHKLVSPAPHDDAATTAPGHATHDDASHRAPPVAHADSQAATHTGPALPAGFDVTGILLANRADAPVESVAGHVAAVNPAAFADHVDARLLAESGLVAHAPILHVLEVMA